jgi:hypothetical protein
MSAINEISTSPDWDGAIKYDPSNANDALGRALLNGVWAGEEISMIRRDDNNQQWLMWRASSIRPL